MTKIQVEKAAVFTGHRDCIYALERLDEQYFFTSGADGLVVKWSLYEPDKGVVIAKIQNSVYALCFLKAYGQLLVGQNFDGIHLIDLESNKAIKSLKLGNHQVFDIKFSENCIWVACGDGYVYCIDYHSFTIKNKTQYATNHARTIAVHPIKKEIVVGYSDGFFRVLDYELQLKKEVNAHQNSIFTLQYSPDYQFLLSGSRDAHLKVWNTTDYDLHTSIVAHMFTINHIAFVDDGRYFVTCSKDKSVKVWQSDQFKLIKVIDKSRHAGHGTSVNKVIWVDKTRILSVSDDKTISFWKLDFDSFSH